MNPKFRAKICHWPGKLQGVSRQIFMEFGKHLIVKSEEFGILGDLLEALRRNGAEHENGVVGSFPPGLIIEGPEKPTGIGMPSPPEVLRQIHKPSYALRNLVPHAFA